MSNFNILTPDDLLDHEFEAELMELADEYYKLIAQDGACTRENAAKFFYNPDHSVYAIKNYCVRCPVRTQCLHYSLITDQFAGTWGGFSELDRDAIVKGARMKMREADETKLFHTPITFNEYMWNVVVELFDECAASPVKLYASRGKSTNARKKKEPNPLVS